MTLEKLRLNGYILSNGQLFWADRVNSNQICMHNEASELSLAIKVKKEVSASYKNQNINQASVKCHGKMILIGEHAVVYGAKAVANACLR